MIGFGVTTVGTLGEHLIGGHLGAIVDTVGIIGTMDGIVTMVGIHTIDRVGEEVILLMYTEEE